jgi:hypothetical protein
MKYLSKEEWEKEYSNSTIGQSFFMGGFSSDCKSRCVHARNEIVFFDENEMLAIAKYNEMMKIQCKESEEFTREVEDRVI